MCVEQSISILPEEGEEGHQGTQGWPGIALASKGHSCLLVPSNDGHILQERPQSPPTQPLPRPCYSRITINSSNSKLIIEGKAGVKDIKPHTLSVFPTVYQSRYFCIVYHMLFIHWFAYLEGLGADWGVAGDGGGVVAPVVILREDLNLDHFPAHAAVATRSCRHLTDPPDTTIS